MERTVRDSGSLTKGELSELATRNELRVRQFGQWLTLLGGVGLVLAGGLAVFIKVELFDIVVAHFPAVCGLPGAALVALYVVSFLEKTSGQIEFEGFGFKFRGASGPIVLWVLCFLSIVGAIKALW